MKIRTTCICPPIPDRRFDWCAVDDDTYDGEGCPIGYGPTEQDAIDDLAQQMREQYEEEEEKRLMSQRTLWGSAAFGGRR